MTDCCGLCCICCACFCMCSIFHKALSWSLIVVMIALCGRCWRYRLYHILRNAVIMKRELTLDFQFHGVNLRQRKRTKNLKPKLNRICDGNICMEARVNNSTVHHIPCICSLQKLELLASTVISLPDTSLQHCISLDHFIRTTPYRPLLMRPHAREAVKSSIVSCSGLFWVPSCFHNLQNLQRNQSLTYFELAGRFEKIIKGCAESLCDIGRLSPALIYHCTI
jgi:hypothetical protein